MRLWQRTVRQVLLSDPEPAHHNFNMEAYGEYILVYIYISIYAHICICVYIIHRYIYMIT